MKKSLILAGLILLIFPLTTIATTTTTLLAGSTCGLTEIIVHSYGDEDYHLQLCNHQEGCTNYQPNQNIPLNATKDYTLKITPPLLNFSDYNTYLDQTQTRYMRIFLIIALLLFIILAYNMLKQLIRGRI